MSVSLLARGPRRLVKPDPLDAEPMAEYEGLALEKDRAARAAVRQVRPGMRVALGTGTTAAYAIRALAERYRTSAGPAVVASSSASETLAQELGLEVRPLAADDAFDVMIDGADEVTPRLALTKGGGGALFREKLLARLSQELWVIVDHTKLVDRLGSRAAIPVEVVPYARPVVATQLTRRRFGVALRPGPNGQPFRTENGNEILDLRAPSAVEQPDALERELRAITGVVETGLFLGIARRVFVGLPDDKVEEITAPDASAR